MPKGALDTIKIDLHLRCLQVYPSAETKGVGEEIATVGVKLSKEQAVNLARALLAATQEWAEIEIVAHRLEKRKTDGTYLLSILPHHHEIKDIPKHHVPAGIDMPQDMEPHLESLKDSPISD
jgi:GNAT superfamily N-acetyltransferase